MGLVFMWPQAAQAHPPDKIFQETRISLTQNSIQVKYRTVYGQILAKIKIINADRDRDKTLSAPEKEAFLQSLAAETLSHFSLLVDDKPVELKYLEGQIAVLDPWHLVPELSFGARVADIPPGPVRITAQDHNFPDQALGPMFFSVHAGPGGKTVKSLVKGRDLSWDLLAGGDLSGDPEPAEDDRLRELFLRPPVELERNRLNDLLERQTLNPWFILTALLTAAGLGAMHALGPGHGKTMVAAYLVGSQGRARDAVILGGTVTLTHVGSVIVVGIAALILSEWFLPQQLYPWFSLVSGTLIFSVGFWMLAKRTPEVQRFLSQRHGHHHGDGHHHLDISPATHHPREINLSSLLTLGISGGMVPCPSALVVLLAAIATGRIVFGLALIMAFSLGLSGVLILLGILAVKSARIMLKSRDVPAWVQNLPLVSGTIIMIIGWLISYHALAAAGIIRIF